MKKLIIINGTMGVGKTVVCRELYKELEQCVWLDGDWCWMMNPFVVNDYNKKMVIENIGFMLRSFLKNPILEYIIFDWVIHQEEIYEIILSEIKDFRFDLFKITLFCNRNELIRRITTDIEHGEREEDNLRNSLSRQSMYDNLSSIKIDTSYMTTKDVTIEIRKVIGAGPTI